MINYEETLISGAIIVRDKILDPQQIRPHFNESELVCPHCDFLYMDSEFLDKIEWARDQDDFPYIINSGYRCLEYNRILPRRSNSGRLYWPECEMMPGSYCYYNVHGIKHYHSGASNDDSAHPQGLGVDIKAVYGSDKWKVRYNLERAGLRRIGIYQNYIHVDDDPTKSLPCLFWGKS